MLLLRRELLTLRNVELLYVEVDVFSGSQDVEPATRRSPSTKKEKIFLATKGLHEVHCLNPNF